MMNFDKDALNIPEILTGKNGDTYIPFVDYQKRKDGWMWTITYISEHKILCAIRVAKLKDVQHYVQSTIENLRQTKEIVC